MGKGIALQFKLAFPENFRAYKRVCDAGELTPGRMLVVDRPAGSVPRYIINFPTKEHWKGDSRLSWIRSGLAALAREVKMRGIRSVAVPPLGCGNGGLDWAEVRPMIVEALTPIPNLQVTLFEPAGAPSAESMEVRTKRPQLTRARAILIRLLRAYELVEGNLTKLEVQKLAYLLQAAGEPLRLDFVKYKYGPYAEKLNFVMQDLEGHYLKGYGDRTVSSKLHLLPGALEAADDVLATDPVARARLGRVAQLIDGFENPYGMELLATVHWIACSNAETANDPNRVVGAVAAWSPRKRERYQASHILTTWHRLKDLGWFEECWRSTDAASARSSEMAPLNPASATPVAEHATRRARRRNKPEPASATH
jgi:O-acetyl-ADP-ribose deacetylase (regulator of RNase III)